MDITKNIGFIEKIKELPKIIETYHQMEFKIAHFVPNDIHRRMNENGLYEDSYIKRGVFNQKGKAHNHNETNLVYSVYLMITMDLKTFGVKRDVLKKVSEYLLREVNLGDVLESENLQTELDNLNLRDKDTYNKLLQNINSGRFFKNIKNKTLSNLFMAVFKILNSSRDIKLYVDSNGECLFVDELDLIDTEISNLSYDSYVVLPLKKYLIYFVGEYATHEFLSRSKILTDKEIVILDAFKKNDIEKLTIKYKNGTPLILETKKYTKIKIQARLSEVLLKHGYEDIIIKTEKGNIIYSEINNKIKL